MMRAARQAVNQTAAEMGRSAPLLIAVTVLTSLAAEDLLAIGMTGSIDEQVLRLARLAPGKRARRRGLLGARGGRSARGVRRASSSW